MTSHWRGNSDVDITATFPDVTGRAQMRWHAGYWDGPLSGYVALDGADGYWVECIEESWNPRREQASDCCKGKCTCCRWSDVAEGATRCPQYTGDGTCCIVVHDRLFLIYKLDPDQEKIQVERHALFCTHVGTHTHYDASGRRNVGQVKPRATWDLFYKAQHAVMAPLRRDQVVGFATSLFCFTPEAP